MLHRSEDRLTGSANSSVEMLAGEMEVGLLERKSLSVNLESATRFGNDLNRGSKVLKLGSFGEIGNYDVEVRSGSESKDLGNHIDG